MAMASLNSLRAPAVGSAAGRRHVTVRCSQAEPEAPQFSSRRKALQLTASIALPMLSGAAPALAEEQAGVDPLRAILRAPADFYRSRQQANGGAKILAPIRASRVRLEECSALLAEAMAEGQPYADLLPRVRAASLNCYLYEPQGEEATLEARASLAQQQIPFSQPCTYRLIHKNALTLVIDSEVEREAGDSLEAVLRSFQLLDDMVERAKQGDPQAVQAVPSLLQQCIDNNLRFERAVKTCIGLPA